MGHEIRSDCGHLQTNGPPFILLFQITLSHVISTNTFAPEDSVPLAPTTEDRLQHLCTAAAPRPTGVWRSACRTVVGSRREGGHPLGNSAVKWRFGCGARQGETTRYSTSITSADADILAAPAAARGAPGCESGTRCA